MAASPDRVRQASYLYEGEELAQLCAHQSVPDWGRDQAPGEPISGGIDPAILDPSPDDNTWRPPDWDAIARARGPELLSFADRQRLAAELDYRLHLMHESATVVGEAAILAAERVQDQQIAALRDNLGEDWDEELLITLVATLLLPVPGGFLAAWMFRPMLRAVTGAGARAAAGPVSRSVARRLGKTRGMSRKAIRSAYPRQTNDGAVLEALKVIDDPEGIAALPSADRRKAAVKIADALNAAGEDMGSRLLPALGEGGRASKAAEQKPLTTEGARTQLLAVVFSLGSQLRVWDARTQYRLRLQALAETLTYTGAAEMLADLRPDVDALASPELGFNRLRASLALELEATVWSLSLARLLCNPPGRTVVIRGGPPPVHLPSAPSLEWSAGKDRRLADYLVDRFFDIAHHWKEVSEKPKHAPVPTTEYGRDMLVLEYLRHLAKQGPLTVRGMRDIMGSVASSAAKQTPTGT